MNLVKQVTDHTGMDASKFYKTTLFSSEALLIGLNCLEPGQAQQPHDHPGQDKFYYVVEGFGLFTLEKERIQASVGEVVWAPAGLAHGVKNEGSSRLTLLVGIAPAP